MSLRYCFETSHVRATLARSKPSDLAVIDSDGISKAVIQAAVSRGVLIYDYINAGALEKGRSYYDKYEHLRLARYEGWSGEYWIDPTAPEWIDHCIDLAAIAKDKGAIGVYLDNSDIYYMVRHIKKGYDRPLPDQTAVYRALRSIVCGINDIGLVVMPNGGDAFVRRFYTEHPTVIKTINQEGCLFEDFKRQPKSERQYRTEYMDWARKKDPDKARLKGESIYYQILAAAAISEIPSHAAIMFTADGFPIMHQSYKHVVEHKDTEDGNN